MTKVGLPPVLASAFIVLNGRHGDITQHAHQRGVCRQRLYRETASVLVAVNGDQARLRIEELERIIKQLRLEIRQLLQQLAQSYVIDEDKQECFAATAQAEGVSLPVARRLLHIILGEATPSVAKLGRYSKRAAAKATAVLNVLDPLSRERVEQVSADEIFVGRRPILMMVEPDSLCWVGAHLTERRDGAQWAEEFAQLPRLEHVLCDAGTGLEKGLEQNNRQRQEQGRQPVQQSLDHFHVVREGSRALRRMQGQVSRAVERAEKAERTVKQQARRGQKQTGWANKASRLWREAEKAMDRWRDQERVWQKLCAGIRLFTPQGRLNDRRQAEALVAEVMPQLEGAEWKKVRRYLQRREMFTYLDRTQARLAALPAEARQAALRAEEITHMQQGEAAKTCVVAAVWLMVVGWLRHLAERLAPGVVQAVQGIIRQSWRGSSAVEGLNSILRMQQSRHRRLTQGMLDLKRLYWNCRKFRTGRRLRQTPYERLGLKLPVENWWELLKIPPEQLGEQMSAPRVGE